MKKNNQYLKSPDLLPIAHKERSIGTFGFSMMWIGMAVVLAAFALGGTGVQSIPLTWVLVASLVGCFIIGVFMVLIGDIGVEHGISFPIYLRAPFGLIGTHIPSLLRGLAASIWFGINSYFGAAAINGILNVLTGFDNWFICFLIFVAVQVFNTSIGIKALEKFADLAAPILILISIWMYFALVDQANASDRNVWAWVENPVSGAALFTAFMTVMVGNMGYWSTLAADFSTLSRFIKAPKYERNWLKRNKSALVGTLVAMPLTQTAMVLIGGLGYIALGNYDPIAAMQSTAGGIVLAILLLMIVFAQWSTNTTANLVPAGTIFSNIGGPKVPFYVGVILAGVIGIVTQPWQLFDYLLPFLNISGGLLSGIVGIIFADYYLVRKRRVNVPELYEYDGQFEYLKGINWAGMISWVMSGSLAVVFQTYSFFVGFFVGAFCYYVLTKFWWFKKFPQAELIEPSDDKYLGITVGRDWVIETEEVSETIDQPVETESVRV
ncbi:NCS1 family transporter [Mesobacillus maritimus]|uniref:NCS1 family transporter n=1 Tax=Mesobacillus maritimus TaxID=1643336 RepID=UPI00203C4925|nr:NCS1 family transporter [Mesobacillus maritimus]MCM3587552.1 NCS1 family transporter [Mesobacillus maritimus]MCM3671197.1 NCS1 family transporter [Mesobacillus maritimus]